MAGMLVRLDLDDYDAWKQVLDSDPTGRKGSATAHTASAFAATVRPIVAEQVEQVTY
jgi:hypothetical protein